MTLRDESDLPRSHIGTQPCIKPVLIATKRLKSGNGFGWGVWSKAKKVCGEQSHKRSMYVKLIYVGSIYLG